jgi:hypothetical protein
MKNLIRGSLMALVVILAGCASTSNPAIGAWDVNLNTPAGALNAVLTIADDGTGMMAMDGLGEAALSDVMLDGNAVSFSANIDAQGQQLSLTFNGTVDGDALTGEIGSPFGAMQVSGTRQ